MLLWLQSSSGGLRASSYPPPSPALCCDLTRRVARSMQTMRHPVTLGSSVPLCPVFSTRRMRRIQATTSCEEGLDGLSRLMKPVLEGSVYITYRPYVTHTSHIHHIYVTYRLHIIHALYIHHVYIKYTSYIIYTSHMSHIHYIYIMHRLCVLYTSCV